MRANGAPRASLADGDCVRVHPYSIRDAYPSAVRDPDAHAIRDPDAHAIRDPYASV